MDAIAQVAAGVGMQDGSRSVARTGKAAVDFQEALRSSLAAGHGAGRVVAHGKDKKASKDADQPEKQDVSAGGPLDESTAATAKPMKADASADAPVVANVVAMQAVELPETPGADVAENGGAAVAGVKNAGTPQHGKGPAASAKKEPGQVPAGRVENGNVELKSMSKGIDEGSVARSPVVAKEAVGPSQAAVPSPIRMASLDGAKSSLRTPVDVPPGLHAGSVPAEAVHAMEASGNVLEVGLASTAHGWLRVRAELSGTGDVSAQVITASAGAAENLHKEVPAISAYLATEQVGVTSLTVNALEKGAGAQDAAMAFSGGASAGQDRESQKHLADGGTSDFDELSLSAGLASFGILPASLLAGGSGGWLSVRV